MKIKNGLKNARGITLISLVITIVVLLILAGVTIATLTGDNGMLTRVQEAKNKTKQASQVEELTLAKMELLSSRDISEITLSNGNIIFKDKHNNIAVIPNKFVISGYDDERNIENGLVIYQIDDNQAIEWTEENRNEIQETYNQFVWIPVENEKDYIRNTTYREENISKTAYGDNYYLPDGIQPIIDNSDSNEQAEKEAVLGIGGFYISRYEAGTENNSLVSKKNKDVLNNITQLESKEDAKKMYNIESAKTSLCSGIQWDVMMNFINGKLDGTSQIYDVESVSYDRHSESTIPLTTGQNEADKVCNIYDLEGNCIEYVAEKNNYDENNPYVGRGGSSTDHTYASNRYSLGNYAKDLRSFRLALYVII